MNATKIIHVPTTISFHVGSRITLPGDYVAAENQERYLNSLRAFAESRAKAIRCEAGKSTESTIQDDNIATAFEMLDQHLIEEALNSIGNKLDRIDVHGKKSFCSMRNVRYAVIRCK